MAWEEVTAFATLGLAAVTAWLAWTTRRLAREAGAETRANWMPVLVPDPKIAIRMNGNLLELPIRNVGRGPALTVRVSLWHEGDDSYDKTYRGHSVTDVVAPGDGTVFQWRDFTPPPLPPEVGVQAWSQLDGQISYGDVGYVRYDTELKVGFRVDGAVTVLNHRFLGSARGRMTRREIVRRRAIVFATRDRGPGGSIRNRLAHRLARITVKRLG